MVHISIHAPRAGSDRALWIRRRGTSLFQSTLPVRGATKRHLISLLYKSAFQSTLPVRGATRKTDVTRQHMLRFQSTLPVRGATSPLFHFLATQNISIHAPRAGSDQGGSNAVMCPLDFNPRSPCGERRCAQQLFARIQNISIHAPRAGSDSLTSPESMSNKPFQSTLPVRGATVIASVMLSMRLTFQSTLPVRGATICGQKQG